MPQNDKHSFSHGPQGTTTIQCNRRANGRDDESKNRSTLMPFENCEFFTEGNDVPNMCCDREEDAMTLFNHYKTYVCQNNHFKLKEINSFLVSSYRTSK